MKNNAAPGFFQQIWLISAFELRRAFLTRRGLLSLTAFILIWYLILLYPLKYTAELLAYDKAMIRHNGLFDFIGFGSLPNWTVPEFGVFWQIALVLFPILSIFLAADQTCSDRDRGTLRFILLRSNRDRVFFGRFSGVLCIQVLWIFASAISVLLLAMYRDAELFSLAMPNLLAVLINLILVVLPFTALMAVLSIQVKSARQATVWAILIWTFMAGVINLLAAYVPVISYFKLLIPGYQHARLSQLSEWQTLELAYLPLIQTIILLALGRWLMARQSL